MRNIKQEITAEISMLRKMADTYERILETFDGDEPTPLTMAELVVASATFEAMFGKQPERKEHQA